MTRPLSFILDCKLDNQQQAVTREHCKLNAIFICAIIGVNTLPSCARDYSPCGNAAPQQGCLEVKLVLLLTLAG